MTNRDGISVNYGLPGAIRESQTPQVSHKRSVHATSNCKVAKMATTLCTQTPVRNCAVSRRPTARVSAGKSFFTGRLLQANVAVSGRGCRRVAAMKVLFPRFDLVFDTCKSIWWATFTRTGVANNRLFGLPTLKLDDDFVMLVLDLNGITGHS